MRLPDSHRIDAFIGAHRRSLVLIALLVACVGTWTGIGTFAWYGYAIVSALPGEAAMRVAGSMPRATTIADVKGRHAFVIFEEQRLPVPLSRVSPKLIAAILAIEDRRFYNHGGLDLIRIAGAALNNVVEGRAGQGGSTITQQLARLTFLTTDKTLRRKLQEVVLATRLERMYTKDQILELYLNKAYFGDGLHGIEAASLGYFGKHAVDLDVGEAALLAGLVKSPSTYAPTVNPTVAVQRRNVVLGAMLDARAIDQPSYRAAVTAPLRLNDALRHEEAYGQYFKEEVRKQLIELFGRDRVYRGGLHVEATIDLDMQKVAEAEVAVALAQIERRQARTTRYLSSTDNPLQAALIAIDPHTGEVRAMVGGRNFSQSRFNRATQSRRQPGSAFKPFVYAAALEQGFTPATLLTGLSQPLDTGMWLPEDEHLEDDALTMRTALRTSSNRAAVRMLHSVGIAAAVQHATRFGLGAMPHVPSVALGSGEVTLQSLTSAFGAFAHQGRLVEPTLVRRVTSAEGAVLYEASPSTRTAVSPTTAFLMTSMLRDVIDAGTAAEARRIGFRLPAAGKTGTTNDYRDAWFVGFTPNIVTGVWVGYDQPRTIIGGGYAAQLAVPLWARFMRGATQGDRPEWFDVPAGVTVREVDRATGRLATDECRRAGATLVYSEYFIDGTAPIDACPLHRSNILRALGILPPTPVQQMPPHRVADDVQLVATPDTVVTASAEPAPPTPTKKRRFWSRVFGIGRKDQSDDHAAK